VLGSCQNGELEQWMQEKKWKLFWKPNVVYREISSYEMHSNWLKNLHTTYPLMNRREETNTMSTQVSAIHRISSTISSTLPEKDINNTNKKDIAEYNEDLAAYVKYIKGGSKFFDGVQNIRTDIVVAVAPQRKNGIPWFGRVISIEPENQMLQVRWMDRLQSKTVYFYLTNNTSKVHYETVICNGVDFEPILGEKLMWKMVTPLCFIQNLNSDSLPTIQQSNSVVLPYQRKQKFDLTQMVFGSAAEFTQFVKLLQ
jgi:hypothetical protein